MRSILVWLTTCFAFVAFSVSASSTDDGIKLLNHKEFKEAKVIFKNLADKGDARAMFWLGVTQFRTGNQFEAGISFLESAKKGNPWAMHVLVPSENGYCEYLGWSCDENWMKKAISGWDRLAEKEDGRAMYALMAWGKKPWWSSIPIINKKKYSELVEKAVKSGGYRAVASNLFPIEKEKRIELLKYAADKGYAPALVYLFDIDYSDSSMEKDINYLKKALNFGLSGGMLEFYYEQQLPEINSVSDIKKLSTQEIKILSEAYYYSLINEGFSGDLDFKPSQWAINSNGDRVLLKFFSDEEKLKIEARAKDFLNKVKPNLFLDESSSINALLNP